MPDDIPSKRKINRRSFLIGATTGAVATGAGAAGLITLQNKSRQAADAGGGGER